MISTKRAKILAQQAWETGTYLTGNDNYFIISPHDGCEIVWKIKGGKITRLQVNQIG